VNDYLARRDGGWMGPVYHGLGLTTGLIIHDFSGLYDPDYVDPGGYLEDERLVHWRPCTRQEAYNADVTYGTNNEFGFDYLRDNTAMDIRQCVQRALHYAIVDEVDNILIDEARTPLIISGPSDQAGTEYSRFARLVRSLKRNTAGEEEEPNGDFTIEERTQNITLTEKGVARVEEALRAEKVLREGESIYDPQHYALTYYLDNALRAQYIFQRDHQYIVHQGRVILVDEHTGRLMPGRRYSEGLHQAIEAKEGVDVKREDVTIATITLQNYFRMY
jgi:preprotein translocase subunit SecA